MDSPIVELRQYTLHSGGRDVLIELFDREFIETQEVLGMRVIGQFRVPEDPERFVWLRGFSGMATRAAGLGAFYGGPVWRAHREVANATMIDSDNVLLLRPARESSGFIASGGRPPAGADLGPAGLIVATIQTLAESGAEEFPDFFVRALEPALAEAGGASIASFVTERRPNDFRSLPVREGVNVFVTFARFESDVAYERHVAELENSERWQTILAPELERRTAGPPEILKLVPTERSLLR